MYWYICAWSPGASHIAVGRFLLIYSRRSQQSGEVFNLHPNEAWLNLTRAEMFLTMQMLVGTVLFRVTKCFQRCKVFSRLQRYSPSLNDFWCCCAQITVSLPVCVRVSWDLELQFLLLLIHVTAGTIWAFRTEPSRSHLPKQAGILLLPPQSGL